MEVAQQSENQSPENQHLEDQHLESPRPEETPPPSLTVEEIFQKVTRGIKKSPDKVKEVNAIYLFRIHGEGGGIYHLNLKDNPGVRHEELEAECTLDIKTRDFLKLYRGTLPGFKAVLTGKLKVKGDLILAARLKEIFDTLRS